jgi:hypothetical protein
MIVQHQSALQVLIANSFEQRLIVKAIPNPNTPNINTGFLPILSAKRPHKGAVINWEMAQIIIKDDICTDERCKSSAKNGNVGSTIP